MMLIPYKMETTFTRVPYANAALIVITSLIFFIPSELLSPDDLEMFVLRDWDVAGLIGCNFLHGGFIHLLGNMLFLWIFGNAVCSAVGNGAYIFLYLFLGVISGAVHLMVDAHPAIGASGAINGIVGMTLVLFPRNKLHSWYWIFIPIIWLWKWGKFTTKTFWMILVWLAFDILGSMGSPDGIAHWMHIGGLAGGIIFAGIAVKFNLIETYHHTIFDMLAGRSEEEDLRRTNALEQQMTSGVLPEMTQDTNQEQAIQNSVEPLPAPSSTPTAPDIQLKKCVGNGTSVVLYVVNNGLSMNALAIRAPQGVTAQMSPSKALRRGETGSIRFNTENTIIDSIEFIIGYQNSGPERHKIRYRCTPAESKLEVIATA